MLLTVKAVAERVKVSAALVYRWINSGMLAHFRVGSKGRRGHIRIEEADLEAFLADQKKERRELPPPPPQRPPFGFKHLALD